MLSFWSQSKQQRVLYAMSVSLDAQAYAQGLLLFGGDMQCRCISEHTYTTLPAVMHACLQPC